MRVIDLLNRIANDEEVPRKFRFAGQIFEKQGSYIEDEDGDSIFDSMFNDFSNLNDEIEIIEEDKKIEKFKDYIPIGLTSVGADFRKKDVFEALLKIGDKINEIIDVINRGD